MTQSIDEVRSIVEFATGSLARARAFFRDNNHPSVRGRLRWLKRLILEELGLMQRQGKLPA